MNFDDSVFVANGETMSGSLDKGWYRVLHIVGKVISKGVSLFSSGSDAARSQELYRSLCRDVELNWAALLVRHSGRVRFQTPPARTHFNYASCLVEFRDVTVQVTEGRAETRVQVKPSSGGEWQEIQEALRVATGGPSTLRPQDSLATFADAMMTNWENLACLLASKL
jgi:hypothetical protein